MISQSERDRVEYELRQKRRRDMINRDQLLREGGREEGREEGRQQGHEEGREEGRRQGVLIGMIQALQKMSGASQPPVSGLEEMTIEELTALVGELENQLSA